MVLSKQLLVLLLLPLILAILAYKYEICTLLFYFYDFGLFIYLIVDVIKTKAHKLITISRICDSRLSLQHKNPVKIIISNNNNYSILLKVKDNYPDFMTCDTIEKNIKIPPLANAEYIYNLIPHKRIKYNFTSISYRYLSYFGLFYKQVNVSAPQEVFALFVKSQLNNILIKISKSTAIGELKQNRSGLSTNFSSLKEYAHGDPLRYIDWKATARYDKPIVKTYTRENEQNLLILVDASRIMNSHLKGMTKYDHALNAAFGLALTGLLHKDNVGIGIFADKPLLYLKPKRDSNYINTIIEACASINAISNEVDYITTLLYFTKHLKERSLVVILTDITDEISSNSLLKCIQIINHKHLTFVATIYDKEIMTLAKPNYKSIPQNLNSLFKRTTCLNMLNDRHLALSNLKKSKCLILDSPIEDFNTELINSYINIKLRNKI